ncbi:queuosine precursor transporter [Piscirickettsia salmonis]|uniref:queuosine precursor transporter n=1 Tax=Piscirickettsia salmonis TaxID=1238 RepID=UPI003EBC830D
MEKVLYSARKGAGDYKLLIPLSCIFVIIQALSTVVIYKPIDIGISHLFIASSALIYTLDYSICNILAEVYGYHHTRRVIWSNALCILVFTLGIQFVLSLPSPSFWSLHQPYDELFHSVWRQGTGGLVAVLVGYFLNSYLIQKLKMMWRGKYFWLRQIASCAVSELVLLTIGYITIFAFEKTFKEIFILIFTGWLWKITANSVQAPFVSLIAKFFKKVEGTDVYDYSTNFSPFRF